MVTPVETQEIVSGQIEGTDGVYAWVLGFCETPYPHITIDYRELSSNSEIVGFGGRSPDGLISLLVQKGYPVPMTLRVWASEAYRVALKVFQDSEDKTLAGIRRYYTSFSEDQIEVFVREGMSAMFRDATVSLALYTYHGIKAADAWNERLDQLAHEYDS